MTAALIIQIIETLVGVITQLVPLFQQGQAVLSATDAAAIKDALDKAEAATASLRPQVDAALTAAAQV